MLRDDAADRRTWEDRASRSDPAWYLDPEVALQKREAHQVLIRRWLGSRPSGLIPKTDLFEDAWGRDKLIFDLFEPGSATLLGTDLAFATVQAVGRRAGQLALGGFVSDARCLPGRPATLDAVLSTSTLDHVAAGAEFDRALSGICSALKPSGTLVITLDNHLNPLYHVLRLLSRAGLTPLRLGFTPTPRALARQLRRKGFEVLDQAWLIHNPRILSTAAFYLARRMCGRHADWIIRWMLAACALQDRIWTRRFMACFNGLQARKHMD
jgi:SAM-dependent methyltransferase